MDSNDLPVILFGYESSPFTNKVRLALRLKQIPYTFVTVPSMMPRPLLRDYFHLTYRKIPVLALGRDLYCDTAIILEALEQAFPNSASLYPPAADGRRNRALIRGFASYWTDRPLFRVTTGLIPPSVWRTSFGTDRAGLIGHKLDPDKLEAKRPRNVANLDLQLSLLEPQLQEARTQNPETPWLFSTRGPSLADISLFYQLNWGGDISAGRGIYDLTGGGITDTDEPFVDSTWNRYPALGWWYRKCEKHLLHDLPLTETKVTGSANEVLERIRACTLEDKVSLVDTPAPPHHELDKQISLTIGTQVSIAPDDTGRGDPTVGTLVALTPEEAVILPKKVGSGSNRAIDMRVHFPRMGFTVVPTTSAKL